MPRTLSGSSSSVEFVAATIAFDYVSYNAIFSAFGSKMVAEGIEQ
jgi:hypothetical protein